MVAWSVVAAAQSHLVGRTDFYICRMLLGVIEDGFIPDVIIYLSYFFKNNELPKCLSWFWTAYQATSIVGAFLAYGIFHLDNNSGLENGWRYVFAIEGDITAFIVILTWFYLPPSPTQTASDGRFKSWLRPKNGWSSQHEEVIMVTRILEDDPGKAIMYNR